MDNSDFLQRFMFENASVRGQIVRLHDSYQTIMQQHQYPAAIRQILGETLVSAGLLAAIIKFKGRLTVQFQNKTKLKLLLAQCNHLFHMRGLAQWEGDVDYPDLLAAAKTGVLNIIIEPEEVGQRYQGMVAWQGDSLAESLEGYFRDSEQLATKIWIVVDETSAVGFLLQAMPGTDAGVSWENIVHSTTERMTNTDLLQMDNLTLLQHLYQEQDIRLYEGAAIQFACTCSIERSENALYLLGREEADEELRDKQVIAVTCEFCSKEYLFDKAKVDDIFKKF